MKTVCLTVTAAVLAMALLFAALANGDYAAAQTADTPTSVPTATPDEDSGVQDLPPMQGKVNPPQYPNMDSNLNRTAREAETGGFTTQAMTAAAGGAPIHREESVAVTLYITEGYADAIAAYLESNGSSPRNIGVDYIEAYIPVSLLAEVSQQEGVISIRTIMPAQPNQSAVVSEGAAAHGAPAWHDAGVKGKDVKIGVIDVGYQGFQGLMGTELPASVEARCYKDVGEFTSDLADCDNADSSKHGAAVTEALFDIAPEATYYISNPISFGDLQSAAQWMIDNDVDVINESTTWGWDGPGDGTSPFSDSPLRAVDTAVSSGIVWANSAGNGAQHTWFGPFEDTDSDRHHNYAGSDECNNINPKKTGERVTLVLRWDDNWLGASRDLDLFLIPYDAAGNLLIESAVSSELEQSGRFGDYPIEFISRTVRSDLTACINVRQFSGAPPAWMQLLSRDYQDLELHTLSGGMGNPAESANPGLLAVGAAPWDITSSIEPYSDQGPAPDGRIKPDIVGADLGQSVTLRSANNPNGYFAGTSQASPHVAGLSALVKQRFPEKGPEQVAQYLKDHAERRGAVPNNTWGYGFAKLPASDAPAPSPTPTPGSVQPTPTPVSPQPTATPMPPTVLDDVLNKLSALETLLGTLQGLVSALTDRIGALEGRLASLDGRIAALEADDTPEPDSTPTPTPTLQPTSTPQLTATPLPPGVTPEPTATMAPTATATPVPNPCRLDLPTGQLPTTVNGSWLEECVLGVTLDDVANGDRYFRDVIFGIVSAQSSWVATLTSDDADTYMILSEWDENAESWTRLDTNDDIVRGNTNSRIEWTPVAGRTYGLTLTIYTATTLGDFTLTVEAGAASGQNSLELSQQEFSSVGGRQHR